MGIVMLRFFCGIVVCSLIAGCGGVSVTPNPEPVAVNGNVTHAGKPVSDVVINFQPIEGGLPAVAPVKEGKFEAHITPGKYTYFVSKAATPSGDRSLAQIPVAYHQGAMDRQVEVTGPGPLEFAMN